MVFPVWQLDSFLSDKTMLGTTEWVKKDIIHTLRSCSLEKQNIPGDPDDDVYLDFLREILSFHWLG